MERSDRSSRWITSLNKFNYKIQNLSACFCFQDGDFRKLNINPWKFIEFEAWIESPGDGLHLALSRVHETKGVSPETEEKE